MEILVKCRSQQRRDLLEYATGWYAKELKLRTSTYTVEVCSVADLRRRKRLNGVVYQTGPKKITMLLDCRLSAFRLLLTLAHEMVHVKQIARGQYKGMDLGRGRVVGCWMGKAVKAKYQDRPWEREAFGREINLLEAFVNRGLKNFAATMAAKKAA